MAAVIDAHLHVWDGSAAGKDAGPMTVGYSPQSSASVELFLDYMEEAGVEKAGLDRRNAESEYFRSLQGRETLDIAQLEDRTERNWKFGDGSHQDLVEFGLFDAFLRRGSPVRDFACGGRFLLFARFVK